MTTNEIAALLEEEQGLPLHRNIVLFPPDDEGYTDEDSEEEEDVSGAGHSIDHLGRGILQQVAEINYDDYSDELPDIERVCFWLFYYFYHCCD